LNYPIIKIKYFSINFFYCLKGKISDAKWYGSAIEKINIISYQISSFRFIEKGDRETMLSIDLFECLSKRVFFIGLKVFLLKLEIIQDRWSYPRAGRNLL
jgi:hypothetical protein